jgi:hypothetical protein
MLRAVARPAIQGLDFTWRLISAGFGSVGSAFLLSFNQGVIQPTCMMSMRSIKLTKTSALTASLLAFIAVLIGLAGFSGALFELVRRWTTQAEYSHGFLIPLVSVWLLWTRRDVVLASIGRPSWTGPILILLAMAMHVTGELSAIFILSQLAFIVALLGITLGIGGLSLLRAAFVPIIFLIFAIPLPYFIDANLSLQLQLISSQLGVFFIRLF